MTIEILKPSIKPWLKKNFYNVKYSLNNKYPIYITDIQFEKNVTLESIELNDNKNRESYCFSFDNINEEINNSVNNLNFFLKFRSTYNRYFYISFLSIDKYNIPDIIMNYEYIEKILDYSIRLDIKLIINYFKYKNKVLYDYEFYEQRTYLGYFLHFENTNFDQLTLIFKNDQKINFDLWECIFIDNFLSDECENKICIVPFIDNFSEIMYCIKNNIYYELNNLIQNSIIKKDNSKIRLEELNFINCQNNDVDFCENFIKDILIDGKKLKNNFLIKGIHLKKQDT